MNPGQTAMPAASPQPAPSGPASGAAAPARLDLYLEIVVNDHPANLIVHVIQRGDALAVSAEDLQQLGFAERADWADHPAEVPLSGIPGLRVDLDMAQQTLRLVAPADVLQPHRYDLSDSLPLQARADWGMALNYDLFGQWSVPESGGRVSGSQATLLDLRAFGPAGRLLQTGTLRRSDDGPSRIETLRLDTRYVYSDVDTLGVFSAGDVISGGNLIWTTPVRLGGLQLQRNFRLLPSFVTFPVPSLNGSAAVPSTVDVYINNTQQASRPVAPGPFSIDNLPLVTGAGEVRLVVRDALGREQVIVRPFYAAPNLLRPGLLDFSSELGFLRRGYGSRSADYGREPVAMTSLRYGLDDGLTVEFHDEGRRGFLNGGLGLVASVGQLGVLSAFAAGSRERGMAGGQFGGSYQFQEGALGLFASGAHSLSGYRTLAALEDGTAPPRDTLQATLSAQIGRGSLGIGYSQLSSTPQLVLAPGATPCTPLTVNCVQTADAATTRNVTMSYSVSLPGGVSLIGSAQRTLARPRAYALSLQLAWYFEGLSGVLGSDLGSGGSARYNAQATQPIPNEGTGGGWSLRATAGAERQQAASAGYRFRPLTAEAGVIRRDAIDNPYLDLRGSLLAIGGGLHLSNPVYDSFGMVDLGVPGIGVRHENRPLGKTDASGRIFVPNLRSFDRNSIRIDAEDVPPDVELGATQQIVVPRDQSGVVIRFPVRRENAAVVTLRQEDGRPVPVGSEVVVEGSSEPALAGFDGVAYLRHLADHNRATVRWRGGRCRAQFDYQSSPGQMVQIGPVTCIRIAEQDPS